MLEKGQTLRDDLVEQRLGEMMGFVEEDSLDRGDADHRQSRRAGGGDAGWRVLQGDHARSGLDAEPATGLQVGIGRRLRGGDFVGAEDDVEVVLEPDQLQRAGNEGER